MMASDPLRALAELEDSDELSSLQSRMGELLRRRRALPDDPGVTEEARRHFTGNDRLTPVEQVEIYREQFWLRHTSSLVEDFPGLGGVLGQADWERLIEEYLVAHAPESYSLRDLGDRLPAFVERAEWLEHRELCVDMARLEWAYVEAFDASDVAGLDAERLATLPDSAWETARILLHPSLRLVAVSFPVAELRRKLRDDSGEAVAIPERVPAKLVVYRARDRNMFAKPVSRAAFELLHALRDGATLVRAAELAVERVPDEASELEAKVGDWFQDWTRLGWIADVEV